MSTAIALPKTLSDTIKKVAMCVSKCAHVAVEYDHKKIVRQFFTLNFYEASHVEKCKYKKKDSSSFPQSKFKK